MDADRCRGKEASRFGEKGTFPAVRLDEMDLRDSHDGEDQARESRAAAQIDQGLRPPGNEGPEACRIQHMAAPKVREALAGNQVDRLLPLGEKSGTDLEPLQCFT